MIAPERLIPELVSAGVLTPADAVLRPVRLVPVGRSHPVFRLEVADVPVAAVKIFGPRSGETDGDPECEAAVQALAGEVPELAALVAPPVAHSGPSRMLVCGWVDGAPAWEGDSLTGGAGTAAEDLERLAPVVMPRLAAMHRATARLAHRGALPPALAGPLDGQMPWGLRVFDGDGPDELWRHATVAPLLQRAGQRWRLVEGVRRARGAWRAVALVHGDLKHDNLLVRADGGIAVVDWEMARLGDPAWDLAGLMFRPLLDPAADNAWSDATVAAGGRLLCHYARASGLAAAPLAQRLVLYCGIWLLMSVIQYRSANANPDEAGIERLLRAAEACFTQCDAVVGRLVQAADAA